MGVVRVGTGGPGRLVRVTLEKVPLEGREGRLDTARRLRDLRWERELRPDVGYVPDMEVRLAALGEAVALMRAALRPRREHLVPETAVLEQIRRGRYEP